MADSERIWLYALRDGVGMRGGFQDKGSVGPSRDLYASLLYQVSGNALIFPNRKQAEFARELNEQTDWTELQSMAADLRDELNEGVEDSGSERIELAEYVARRKSDLERLRQRENGSE